LPRGLINQLGSPIAARENNGNFFPPQTYISKLYRRYRNFDIIIATGSSQLKLCYYEFGYTQICTHRGEVRKRGRDERTIVFAN
jgi:hypothetical protein